MIAYKSEYRDFIIQQGVGKNDIVASSPDSYISYLRGASRLLDQDISPELIQNKEIINELIQVLDGQKAPSTLLKYKTALNQYLRFCLQRQN